MTQSAKSAFADKKMLGRAIKDSFIKLNPKTQVKNPVMLLVYISAILTSGLWLVSLFGIKDASNGYTLAIAVILLKVLFINLSNPPSKAPPPVRIIPFSYISPTSSGGVSSRRFLMASTISNTSSSMASKTSISLILIISGSPFIKFLPPIFILTSSLGSYKLVNSFFIDSAVLSPISNLCLF